MAKLTNPYNGKTVEVPESSVELFKARGFKDAPKPRATRRRAKEELTDDVGDTD